MRIRNWQILQIFLLHQKRGLRRKVIGEIIYREFGAVGERTLFRILQNKELRYISPPKYEQCSVYYKLFFDENHVPKTNNATMQIDTSILLVN